MTLGENSNRTMKVTSRNHVSWTVIVHCV